MVNGEGLLILCPIGTRGFKSRSPRLYSFVIQMESEETEDGMSNYQFDEFDLQLHDLRISKEKIKAMKDSDELGPKIIEGYRRLLDGDIEESLQIFDSVLDEERRRPKVWYGKGLVNLLLGDLDEAVQNFEKAVSLKPDFKDALYEKGVALHEKGKTQEALEYWKRARKKEEDY